MKNGGHLTRWAALPIKSKTYHSLRCALWTELCDWLGLTHLTVFDDETEHLIALLNCLLSLELGRPIGSNQRNLAEVLDSFFYAKGRHVYAKIVEYAARVSDNGSLLDRPPIRKKFARSEGVAPGRQVVACGASRPGSVSYLGNSSIA